MNCLICHQFIEADLTWSTIFNLRQQAPICRSCSAQLDKIGEPQCEYCGRDDQAKCLDCDRWKQQSLLTKNRAVYRYNHFLKDLISRFKYRGDYALVEVFRHDMREVFTTQFKSISKDTRLVPIPLSEQRLASRAFNQAEAIAQLLPYPIAPLLKRTTSEKQAKKNRKQRLSMDNPFQYIGEACPSPVIIIDDIYTTGATIHHAARVLKENGIKQIASFTLAR